MTIKGSEGINREIAKLHQETAAQQKVKKEATEKASAGKEDRVEIGAAAQDINASLNLDAEAAARAEKVRNLKAQIEKGTYDSSFSKNPQKLEDTVRNMFDEVDVLRGLAED